MSMRPSKTQISLGICSVWSESSLCAQWVAKDPVLLHADSEDSDQMPRLIWVMAGRTGHFVGFVAWQLLYLFLCNKIVNNFMLQKQKNQQNLQIHLDPVKTQISLYCKNKECFQMP